MKEVFKKTPKKIVAIILVLAMVGHYFLPLGEVFANEPQQNSSYTLTFTVAANSQTAHTMEADGNHLKIDGQYVDLRDAKDSTKAIGTVSCTSSTSCKIEVADGTPGKLDNNEAAKFTLYVSGHRINYSDTINANEAYAVQDYENNNPVEPGQEPGEPAFDGKAYLVWSCGTGVCYHYFDNIPNFDDGNSTFYKDTEIEADNKPGTTFSINAEYKGWYLKEELEKWADLYEVAKGQAINWNTLDPELILGSPKQGEYLNNLETRAINAKVCEPLEEFPSREDENNFRDCIHLYAAQADHEIWTHQLQPVGEPQYKNAYVSYGDRNFKVVIYNSNYKGVAIGSLDELNYYPLEWVNPFTKRDQYDISGSTKEKPTGIDTVLLEKIVRIKEIGVNGYTITSIKALDVPADAVIISKDVEKNEWKFEFTSNFYDNVVFEVKDSNGGTSYIQIKRSTIDAWIPFKNNHPVLHADFWFDRTKSYADFELTAIIVYKDGTEKNVTLEAVYGIDDGLGNVAEKYEDDLENPTFHGPGEDYERGKGLKKSSFEYQLEDGEDRQIKKVYINAEYKGSTGTEYAGNYAGSGRGVLANIYDPEEEQ